MNELSKVQQLLKAPKDQVNGFGKYKYRKAEDILQSVKPHLEKDNLSIVMSDDIEVIGDRYFLKATASLCNNEGTAVATTHAFAELDDHKGMSKEQSIGSASSYARKYALCGLLAIDDSSNDPDTMEAPKTTVQPIQQSISPLMKQIQSINTKEDVNALIEPIRKATQPEQMAYINLVKKLGLTYDKDLKQYK